MTVTHVTATISPKPGKEARVQELLGAIAHGTAKDEPNCGTFFVTKSVESSDFIVIETYKSMDDFDFHKSQQYFLEFAKALEAEGLVTKPPAIIPSEKIPGFGFQGRQVYD